MVNIILIYPSTFLDRKGYSIGLPLSLLHASTLLAKKGYNIKIIDQRLDKNWKNTLKKGLNPNLLLVGISAMTGAQIFGGLKAAEIVRKYAKKVPLAWGGVHCSLLPYETLKDKYVDIVVIGEGERTFFELTEALKKNADLSKIKGIGYKKKGKLYINENREFENINRLPPPPYHLVNVKNYFLNLYQSKHTLSLLTGKGCPFRCAYCYNTAFNKRRWRALSAKKVFRMVKVLKGFGAETIDLVDDNFFVDQKRVEEFCNLMINENLNIKFMTNCRIDYLFRFNLKFLQKLYKAGFRELFIGVESGSDRILSLIKKDITVAQVLKVNKKLKQAGLKPIYSFMGGFPKENVREIKKTVQLMLKLSEENPNASLTSLKIYTPFPGTELYGECLKRGFTPPTNLAGWGNFNYNTLKHNWMPNKEKRLLTKLAFMTYFLDQKSMIQHVGGNFLLEGLIKFYSKLVYWRCKKNFYAFTPEVKIMLYLKDKIL